MNADISIKKIKRRGFGIVEILVAAAIIGLGLTGLAAVGNFALRAQANLKKSLMATNLASEAMEATKSLKDGGWSNISALTIDAPYHPAQSGSPLKWSLVAGEETTNEFSRKIILSQVQRDANDDIAESGGIIDPNTRKITVTVFWNERGRAYETILTSYIADWKP
ncbi:MAG: prepilin-type N-terminal cleavage/methylation domain-containing protein [bacterium]